VDEKPLSYDAFDPSEEGLREALTSTGNGYFCTRGTAEWEDADDVHYPGTYAHGVYNRETTIMGGRPVLNEDLVNLPNWLVLKLKIEGEDAIRLDNVDLLDGQTRVAVDVREVRHAAGAQIVEHRDAATVGKEPFDQMAADEPGAAGDKDGLVHHPAPRLLHVTTRRSHHRPAVRDAPQRPWSIG